MAKAKKIRWSRVVTVCVKVCRKLRIKKPRRKR
jgi:hypothetical protein